MKHTIYSQNKFECQTKGAFIPTMLTLHPDKSVIFSANEKGLIQCWDIALNPIYLSLSAEADFNMGGSNILDIGHNFNRIPIGLCDMKWYEKSKFNPTFMETMAFNYLCLRYESLGSGGLWSCSKIGLNYLKEIAVFCVFDIAGPTKIGHDFKNEV